jgi:hypothetical protein
MCSLRFENNLFTIEGVHFASISKKTPLSKLSFASVLLALPLLVASANHSYCLAYSYPRHKGFVNPPVCPHCHCTKLWLLWPVQESLILLFLSTRRNHEGVRRSKYTTLNPNPDVLHHVMYSLHNPSESERPFSPLEEPILPALGRRGGGARNGFPCCAPATPRHWPRRS